MLGLRNFPGISDGKPMNVSFNDASGTHEKSEHLKLQTI